MRRLKLCLGHTIKLKYIRYSTVMVLVVLHASIHCVISALMSGACMCYIIFYGKTICHGIELEGQSLCSIPGNTYW